MVLPFVQQEKKFSMYVAYWTDHVTSAAYLDDEEAQEFLKVRVRLHQSIVKVLYGQVNEHLVTLSL